MGVFWRRASPNRWRWNAALASTGPGRLTVLPHEAVLLNSVRRLLSVVPQTEHTISTWASGPSAARPAAQSDSPHSKPLSLLIQCWLVAHCPKRCTSDCKPS